MISTLGLGLQFGLRGGQGTIEYGPSRLPYHAPPLEIGKSEEKLTNNYMDCITGTVAWRFEGRASSNRQDRLGVARQFYTRT